MEFSEVSSNKQHRSLSLNQCPVLVDSRGHPDIGARRSRVTIAAAVPSFSRIGRVKHTLSKSVEDLKIPKLLNGYRQGPEQLVMSVIVRRKGAGYEDVGDGKNSH